jgi:hypothetical protein
MIPPQGGATLGLVAMDVETDGSLKLTMLSSDSVAIDAVAMYKADGTKIFDVCTTTAGCANGMIKNTAGPTKLDLAVTTASMVQTYMMRASVGGNVVAQCNPAVASAEHYATLLSGVGGSGVARLNITGTTVAWDVFLLPIAGANNAPTAMHIHNPTDVLVTMPGVAGATAQLRPNVGTPRAVPAAWSAASLDKGEYYINVHSTANAAGAFRGDIHKVKSWPPAPTPTASASGSANSTASALAPALSGALIATAAVLLA